RMRCVEMFLMRALVWKLSVTMPIWAPVKLIAFSLRDWIAMAMRAMEICSPVDRSMSISRAGGCSLISRARSISSSVVSPRALTTTMTSWPVCLARMARRAAAMMRSAVATLLPPNSYAARGKVRFSRDEKPGILSQLGHDSGAGPRVPGDGGPQEVVMKAEIIDRGRGPEIAGTRITVYTILEYADWHHT